MEYTEDVTLNMPKNRVLEILGDPYRVAGMIGHLSLLKIKDGEDNKFKPPNAVKKPMNEYVVVLVFQDDQGRLKTVQGVMKGPAILPNSVEYEGGSEDKKMSFKLIFNFLPSTVGTRLSIRAELTLKTGFFERLFSADIDELATPEHVVKAHIIPYLKIMDNQREKPELALLEVESVEVDVLDAIKMIRKMPNMIGFVSIQGSNFMFNAFVNQGELANMYLKVRDKEYIGGEALGKLLNMSGKALVKVYEIPVSDIIKLPLIKQDVRSFKQT